MAHIQIRRQQPGGASELIINGVDFSMEAYNGTAELVEVGDAPFSEVGFRFTIAVDRLDLETERDVKITDRFWPVAQRVREITEAPPPPPPLEEQIADLRESINALRDSLTKESRKAGQERRAR